MKLHVPKQKPKITYYRDYKKFRNKIFRAEFDKELLNHDICNNFSNI